MKESVNALSSVTGTLDPQTTLLEERPTSRYRNGNGTLCGRKVEKLILNNTYQNFLQNERGPTILVRGISGSGKTTLVESLHGVISESGGYFCSGKFFQDNDGGEPYSAIMAAFSDLCDLLSQAGDFHLRLHDIQNKLKPDGIRLQSLVSMSSFLDSSTIFETSDTSHSKVTFQMLEVACKSFLRAMSSKEHPVVLLLDDIQWMDQGSQKLIQALIDETDWKHVMLVVICREEDFSLISDMFEGKEDDSLLNMMIKNLNVDEVHDLVTNILELDLSSTQHRSLSELIYQRTLGSPFYVIEFLDLLLYEKMIIRNYLSASEWSYDIDMIRQETMIADTLVHFLLSKVQRIDTSLQEALSIAALIGFRFHSTILIDALDSFHHSSTFDQSSTPLLEAQLYGFIEPLRDKYFQFKHDKIQFTFQSMLTDDKTRKAHNHIAKAYLAQGDDESYYRAVRHLMKSYKAPSNDDTNVSLAQVCFKASVYCRERSDFFNAAFILRFAWNIIPQDQKWSRNYDITLSLSIALAKVEMILGNFEACRQFNNEVLKYARSVEDQLEALETSIEEAIADNRTKDCEVALYEALTVVNVRIPRKISTFNIMRKLILVKAMLRGKSNDFILGMSMMTDTTKIVAVKLLMFGAVFGLRSNNEKHSIYCSLVAIELCMKFGLSKYTADAFAIYSMALLVLGKLSIAYEFANLARTLNEQLKCRDAGSISILLVNNMFTHWKEPIRDLIRPTNIAIQSCMETGDLSFGIFGTAILMGLRTCAGHHLEVLREDFNELYSNYKCYRTERCWRILEPNLQFIINLSSGSLEDRKVLTELSGEVMIEAEYIQNAITSKSEVLLPLLYVLKIQLAFYFNQFILGEVVLQKMEAFKKILSYGFNFCRWQLFGSLIYYARYYESSKWKYVRMARRYKRTFQSRVMIHCPNARPLLMILDAEEASISRSECEALKEYKKAIQALSDEAFVNLEALACELAGKFLVRKGIRAKEAITFFERSLHLYEHGWGAIAKANDLREFTDVFRKSITSANGMHFPSDLIEFVDTSNQNTEWHSSERNFEIEFDFTLPLTFNSQRRTLLFDSTTRMLL